LDAEKDIAKLAWDAANIEQVAALRRIVIDLVDVLMAEQSGMAGNWGYEPTFKALTNIKSNLLSISQPQK
jgi:hypothetical protein